MGKASKLERSRKSTEVSDDAAVAADHDDVDDEIHTKFMKRNVEIFDANEESKQNDVFEGFYDDKLNCDEDVNDADKKPKALGIKVERPRSFRSIKKFFEVSFFPCLSLPFFLHSILVLIFELMFVLNFHVYRIVEQLLNLKITLRK